MSSAMRLSYAGIGEMLVAPFMMDDMGERADRVLARCIETAPVYDGPIEDDDHRGRYKESFHKDVLVKVSSRGTRRACGRVWNDAPEARFVEYGNGRNGTAYHILTDAMFSAGS